MGLAENRRSTDPHDSGGVTMAGFEDLFRRRKPSLLEILGQVGTGIGQGFVAKSERDRQREREDRRDQLMEDREERLERESEAQRAESEARLREIFRDMERAGRDTERTGRDRQQEAERERRRALSRYDELTGEFPGLDRPGAPVAPVAGSGLPPSEWDVSRVAGTPVPTLPGADQRLDRSTAVGMRGRDVLARGEGLLTARTAREEDVATPSERKTERQMFIDDVAATATPWYEENPDIDPLEVSVRLQSDERYRGKPAAWIEAGNTQARESARGGTGEISAALTYEVLLAYGAKDKDGEPTWPPGATPSWIARAVRAFRQGRRDMPETPMQVRSTELRESLGREHPNWSEDEITDEIEKRLREEFPEK